MVKSNKLVPELRFSEFSSFWKEEKLGDYMIFKNGVNADKSMYGRGYKFINVLDVISGRPIVYENIIGSVSISDLEYEKNEVVYGDILFQRSSETREEVGQSNVYMDKQQSVTFGGFVIRGRPIKKFEPIFFHLLLKTSFVRKDITTRSGGSTRYNVGQESLSAVKIVLPQEITEQQKIASFLTAVDQKLSKLIEKRDLLQEYKKGLMQQLFSQQLRFKQDDGSEFPDWEEVKFEDVFKRIVRKNIENNNNVLTISAQKGLINQEDYFNKSVSAKDVTGYYLLKKNDFAYNKSYSKGYPMGAIKRLSRYEKGVVSTLYICFKCINNLETNFYEHYFESGALNKELKKIAQEGARNHGLLNMSVVEFFRDIPVIRPCIKEQKKIAFALSKLEDKLVLINESLIQAQNFKRGLLQKMFV